MLKHLTNHEKKKIRRMHKQAYAIIEEIDSLVDNKADRIDIQDKVQELEDLEFRMQDFWGFQKNSNYHTWWFKPKNCTCPKLDNTDPVYFGGGKLIAGDCPIHSTIKNK